LSRKNCGGVADHRTVIAEERGRSADRAQFERRDWLPQPKTKPDKPRAPERERDFRCGAALAGL